MYSKVISETRPAGHIRATGSDGIDYVILVNREYKKVYFPDGTVDEVAGNKFFRLEDGRRVHMMHDDTFQIEGLPSVVLTPQP